MTVISAVEKKEDGSLIIRSSRYGYAEEQVAPIIRTTTATTRAPDPVGALVTTVITGGLWLLWPPRLADHVLGDKKNEQVVGESVGETQARGTGETKWHRIDTGSFPVSIKVGDRSPKNVEVKDHLRGTKALLYQMSYVGFLLNTKQFGVSPGDTSLLCKVIDMNT